MVPFILSFFGIMAQQRVQRRFGTASFHVLYINLVRALAFSPTCSLQMRNSLIFKCLFLILEKCTTQIFRFRFNGGDSIPKFLYNSSNRASSSVHCLFPLVVRQHAWLWCLPRPACWQSSSIRAMRFGFPSSATGTGWLRRPSRPVPRGRNGL